MDFRSHNRFGASGKVFQVHSLLSLNGNDLNGDKMIMVIVENVIIG